MSVCRVILRDRVEALAALADEADDTQRRVRAVFNRHGDLLDLLKVTNILVDEILQAHLIKHLIIKRIIVVQANEIRRRQSVLCTIGEGRGACIGRRFCFGAVDLVAEHEDHFVRRREAVHTLREAVEPVAAGQIPDLDAEAVEISLTKLVLDYCVVDTVRFEAVCRDSLFDSRAAAIGRQTHRVQRRVQRIMRAVAGGKIVVSGLQEPGAGHAAVLIALVVGIKVDCVEADGELLGFVRLEQYHIRVALLLCLAGLAVAYALDGALFDAVRTVTVGIGDGNIKLYRMLGGNRTDVRHLNRHARFGLTAPVDVRGGDLLGKARALNAVAEGVADFLVIIPGLAVHTLALGCLGGVALLGQRVEVAGLVILVALVNAFQLCQIPAGAQAVVAGRLNVRCVVKDIDTVVLRGGRERRVDRPCIRQVAGWQHGTLQQLRNAISAVAAWIANPEDGIHRIVLLEFLNFHRGAGVEQHNDFLKSLPLDPVDQVTLIV